MLLRNREPSREEIWELLTASASRLTCDECERSGLLVSRGDENVGDWPEARRCADCGRPISAERLEALPGAILCVDCQQSDDRGATASEGDYCPRCGSAMVVRPTRSAGITRNELVCSDSPRCRGRG